MTRFKKKAFQPMDEEEKELMKSIDRNEWKLVNDLEQQKQKAMEAAKNTLKKNRRINLRLSEKDYRQIQIKAVEESMPYQIIPGFSQTPFTHSFSQLG